uniref:Nanos-type domain-containing protein n=1 Tax=viral metagenome TaxID=1070528 RepID=A0A6C0DCG1_9ZZZZ
MANRNNTKQTKFCKFCKDSGKNETIYTSHNVKDKKGNLCCPILMTTLCKNCGNFGHTIKFCKSVNFENNKKTIQKPITQIRVEIKKNNNVNRFSAFDDDDEDEPTTTIEPEKDVKKECISTIPRRRIENWADYCSDSDDD